VRNTARHTVLFVVAAVIALACSAEVFSEYGGGRRPESDAASPIYGVMIPQRYRQWELIAPAQEAEPLNELRAVLGNSVAIKAYMKGKLPFPDGTVLAKLAWQHAQSPEFEAASVPGAATTLQIMIKDSKKYSATGGWGFGRFVNGRPADKAQHQTCFGCHEGRVKAHDFVFTRFAP